MPGRPVPARNIGEQRCCTVGDMNVAREEPFLASLLQRPDETFCLKPGILQTRFIQLIGAGEMRDEPLQHDIGKFFQLVQEERDIGKRNTETPHPGIDFEMDLRLAKQLLCSMIKRFGLFKCKNGGGQVVANAFSLLSWIDPPQQRGSVYQCRLS